MEKGHTQETATGNLSDNRELPAKMVESIYTTMCRIRAFEQHTIDLFNEGVVKGTAHSYMGEEAIASAVCANLRKDDFIASYHRGHGHCIAKGANIDRMMAELMGKETGYCRGLGGSMHIADMDLNILGANGIVGAGMPLATGAALASQLKGDGQVAVSFFGDGANNQGVFHESMNLASVWKLPLIFICENNQYALSTSYKATTAVPQVAMRGDAYAMPSITVDGNDITEVYLSVQEAVERARAGEGPSLIEAMTYRWGQHSMRANLRDPRPKKEYEEWMERDPIARVKESLISRNIATKDKLNAIDDSVEEELAAAVKFGIQSAQPSIQVMKDSVYAPHTAHTEPSTADTARELHYSDALNEALHQEMSNDENVLLIGEDVGETGGIFQVSKGLFETFGPDRVRDTPISEATFVGCGIGAAISGLRPVVEIQIFDFVALTMDMLVNQAAKFRYMLGGHPTVPIVVRGPQGGGIRLAAQHSQSLEAWFTHVPGLVVIAPSTPYDAKGLLTAAIRDDNPVIFLEQKLLYLGQPGPVPEAPYAIPIGKADIKRPGTDITVVATSAMVPRALSAASVLEGDGISVEVIDPRTLKPLDEETILHSVRKTNRLLIVHEACQIGGFGAEVASIVVEKAFDYLDAPIVRLGAPDAPIPYNDELERQAIPSQERIIDKVREILA